MSRRATPTRPWASILERGAGTVLTATVALVIVAATLVGVWAVGWVTSHHRAARIADLAALAGAEAIARGADGCATARATARRNGGTVRDCTTRGTAPSFVLVVTVSTPLRPEIRGPGVPRTASATAAAGTG
ncbi:Rv3654c family TadE-like protein [Propionibacteriaceae bacterium G1746]|uniref:Rv3654c family TadE-like protein n=1 Tax=Aestuariimicrobium sp. G57 TaxID=3418485 RepID=UPI003C168CDA